MDMEILKMAVETGIKALRKTDKELMVYTILHTIYERDKNSQEDSLYIKIPSYKITICKNILFGIRYNGFLLGTPIYYIKIGNKEIDGSKINVIYSELVKLIKINIRIKIRYWLLKFRRILNIYRKYQRLYKTGFIIRMFFTFKYYSEII